MSLDLAVSPLFSSVMPEEMKIKCLAYFTIPELCKSGEVCKEWFELLRDKVLWTPIFTQLNPFSERQFTVGGQEDIKSEVLFDLQKNQKQVDQVISFIDNDEQLASIISHSSISLEDLRKMLPIERTWHVMRGLRKDCTQLLVYLPKKNKSDLDRLIQKESMKPGVHPPGQLAQIAYRFYAVDEKSLPFFLECVKSPFGPYDAGKAISATLTLFEVTLPIPKILSICACIVKSHPNLSSFFKTNFCGSMGDIPMTSFLTLLMIPLMVKDTTLGVTMEDWTQCGFVPDVFN